MPGNEGSCFVAGTQVVLSDGRRVLIEEVKIGDKLLGMAGSVNEVLEFDHPKLGDRSLFSFNNGKPFVTIEHPFMTTDGWKSIDPSVTLEEMPEYTGTKLNEGDTLIKADRLFKLNELESHEADPETQLYNFKLDGNHTYYADGFLVHNKDLLSLKDTASRMEQEQQWRDAGWTTEQVSSGWGKEKTWSTKWIPPTTQPASTTPAPTGDTAGTEPEAPAAPTEEDTSDFVYHNMPIDNFTIPESLDFQRNTTTSGNPYAPSTVSNPLGADAIPGLNSVIGGDVRTGRTSLGSPSPGQNADGTRGTSPWSPLGINTAPSGLPDFGEGGGYQPKYKVGTNLSGGGSNFFGGIQALSMASGAQGEQAQSNFFGGAFDMGADVHGGGEGEGGQTDATTAAGVLGLGVNAIDAMKLGFAITMGMPGLVAVQKALGFELTDDKFGIMNDVAELSEMTGLSMTEIAHSIINEDDVFDMPQTIVDFEDIDLTTTPTTTSTAGTDGGYTPGPSDMSLGTSLHGGFGDDGSSSGSAGGAGSAGSGTGEGASASGAGAGPHGGDSGGFGGGDGDGGGGGDGSGCFSADTLFLMEDNTFKRIKDIQVGDEVKGGMVTLVKSGMSGRLWYDYHGTHATDDHFVLERGEWKYVKDADDAVLIDGHDMFYTLNCTNHLLYGVNDQVFSDDAVFDSWGSEKESWDAMLVELNKGLK